MKPKYIKKILLNEIKKVVSKVRDYCSNPEKDFTRNRKLPMEKIIKGIIGMESKSLTNELIDLFECSAVEWKRFSRFRFAPKWRKTRLIRTRRAYAL